MIEKQDLNNIKKNKIKFVVNKNLSYKNLKHVVCGQLSYNLLSNQRNVQIDIANLRLVLDIILYLRNIYIYIYMYIFIYMFVSNNL